MSGRLAADRVLAALLDDQRDEGALALEVLESRGVAADRDDLPRRVAQGVQEEGALLPDHVLELGPAQLAVPDHVEERMVEPGVGLTRLAEQRFGERGGGQRHRVPPGRGRSIGRIIVPTRAPRKGTWSIVKRPNTPQSGEHDTMKNRRRLVSVGLVTVCALTLVGPPAGAQEGTLK